MALTFLKWAADGSLLTSSINSNYNVKIYPLICDRLTITCDLPATVQDKVISNFKQEKAKFSGGYDYSSLVKNLEMQLPPYAIQDDDADKVTTATIQCKPQMPGAAFLRLDYNPSKVAPWELKCAVDINWLNIPGYGFDYLFENGKVTRLDLAVDIAAEHVDAFLYRYPKLQYVEVIEKSVVKSGRTQYLGAKSKSGKRIVIYDRVPALKSHNAKKFYDKAQQIPLPDMPVMRIEIRLYPDIPFKKIIDLKNPFEDLTVAFMKPGQYESDPMWDIFLALARFEGAQATLGRLSKEKKAEYVGRLKKATVPWWKPEKIWEQFPVLVASLNANKPII